MSNCCPYCQSDRFHNNATQENDTQWVNRCQKCNLYSLYDEPTDMQLELDEQRRVEG